MNCLFRVRQESQRGFAKLKEDFGLADSAVTKAFMKVKNVSSEMFIRSFQFKILNKITFTNSCLAKIGYVQDDSCTFCRVSPELLIIYFMNVFILTSFGKISKIFGLHFLVNMLNFPCGIF